MNAGFQPFGSPPQTPCLNAAAATGITARVKDGVLMVRVPRVPKVEPVESDIIIA
jgi:HSP20 family molecular chaperone IbpA